MLFTWSLVCSFMFFFCTHYLRIQNKRKDLLLLGLLQPNLPDYISPPLHGPHNPSDFSTFTQRAACLALIRRIHREVGLLGARIIAGNCRRIVFWGGKRVVESHLERWSNESQRNECARFRPQTRDNRGWIIVRANARTFAGQPILAGCSCVAWKVFGK